MQVETDMVLSAIRRGEDSLPKLRTATGMEYAKLEPVLYKLEFEWRSIRRTETPDGFARFSPAATEKTAPFKGTDWHEATPITPQAFRTTRSSVDAQELALLQRDAPFCVGCHGLCILHGTDRNERVRWRCKPCGLSFVGSGCPGNPIVNQIREEKREQAISAFNEAKSVRQVAAEVGISKGTAQKIRAEENIEVLCPCGKDAKHQGWCAYRYAQSPERQAVIAKMHMAHIDPHEQAEQEIAAIVERGSARREQLGDEEEKFLNEMRGGELSEEEARIAEEIDSELAEVEEPEKQHLEVFDARNEVCGCGRQLPHGGRCSARRTPGQKSASKEIAEMLAESRKDKTEAATSNGHNTDNAPIADIAENSVPVEKPKQAMAIVGLPETPKYQIKYEGLTVYCDTIDEVEALAQRFTEKITEAAPPQMPTTIRLAWPKDFEDESTDGMPGLTLCYLNSLLHDRMEQHEKEAVWTLILYIKRMQRAVEEAKV